MCVFLGGGTHNTRDMCFPGGGTHNTRDICFPGGGTHNTRDMCFVRGGTHNTRDMCFPGGGTHNTREMCFSDGGTHIPRDMCFLGGEHISHILFVWKGFSRTQFSDLFCPYLKNGKIANFLSRSWTYGLFEKIPNFRLFYFVAFIVWIGFFSF